MTMQCGNTIEVDGTTYHCQLEQGHTAHLCAHPAYSWMTGTIPRRRVRDELRRRLWFT